MHSEDQSYTAGAVADRAFFAASYFTSLHVSVFIYAHAAVFGIFILIFYRLYLYFYKTQ